MRKEV